MTLKMNHVLVSPIIIDIIGCYYYFNYFVFRLQYVIVIIVTLIILIFLMIVIKVYCWIFDYFMIMMQLFKNLIVSYFNNNVNLLINLVIIN